MNICNLCNSSVHFCCQKFGNNSDPEFRMGRFLPSISSVVTVRFGIRGMHTFAMEHLLSWFSKLLSYQTFNTRLNMLYKHL
jgi:hypothetical protein